MRLQFVHKFKSLAPVFPLFEVPIRAVRFGCASIQSIQINNIEVKHTQQQQRLEAHATAQRLELRCVPVECVLSSIECVLSSYRMCSLFL